MASTKKGDRLSRKGDRVRKKEDRDRLSGKRDRLRGVLRDFYASPSGLGQYLGERARQSSFPSRISPPSINGSQLRGSPTIAISPDEIVAAENAIQPSSFPSRVAPVATNTSQLRGSPVVAVGAPAIRAAEISTGMTPPDNRMPTFREPKTDRLARAAPKQARLGVPDASEIAELQKADAQFRSLPPDRQMPNGTPDGVTKMSHYNIGAPTDDGYQPSTLAPDQIPSGDVNQGGALRGIFSAGATPTGPNKYGVVDPSQAPMGPDGVADPFGNNKPANRGGVLADVEKNAQRLSVDPTTASNAAGANPVETGSPPYSAPRAPDLPSPREVADLPVSAAQAVPGGTGPLSTALKTASVAPDTSVGSQVSIPGGFSPVSPVGDISLPDAGVTFAPSEGFGTTQTVADLYGGPTPPSVYPDAPKLSTVDEIRNDPRLARDAKAFAVGGLPGVAASEIGSAIGRWAGSPMGGDIEPNAVGRIADAMGGARGSLGRSLSNPGSSYLSLGPNQGGIYTSGKYGWKEVWGPDGSIRSVDYGPNQGGILGAIRNAVGAMFGGRGYGRASNKVDNSYFDKTPGLY